MGDGGLDRTGLGQGHVGGGGALRVLMSGSS